MIEGRFMTLCFAYMESPSAHGCGLPMPVRNSRFYGMRASARKFRLLAFPWECSRKQHTTSAAIILDPGDVVVFYSDGIADAQNSTGEFFGHKRVAEILTRDAALAPDTIADHMLEEADTFSGGKHPADDRTLLVLKVR